MLQINIFICTLKNQRYLIQTNARRRVCIHRWRHGIYIRWYLRTCCTSRKIDIFRENNPIYDCTRSRRMPWTEQNNRDCRLTCAPAAEFPSNMSTIVKGVKFSQRLQDPKPKSLQYEEPNPDPSVILLTWFKDEANRPFWF